MTHMDAEQETYVRIPLDRTDILIRALQANARTWRQWRLEEDCDESEAASAGDNETADKARAKRELFLSHIRQAADVAALLRPTSDEAVGLWASIAQVALEQTPGPEADRLAMAVLKHIAITDGWA